MLVQLPSTDNSMMNVVNSTIITAMPSTPTVKRMPQLGIQATSTTDCHACCPGSKFHHNPSETTNSTANVASASIRGVAAAPETTSSSAPPFAAAPCSQIA